MKFLAKLFIKRKKSEVSEEYPINYSGKQIIDHINKIKKQCSQCEDTFCFCEASFECPICLSYRMNDLINNNVEGEFCSPYCREKYRIEKIWESI